MYTQTCSDLPFILCAQMFYLFVPKRVGFWVNVSKRSALYFFMIVKSLNFDKLRYLLGNKNLNVKLSPIIKPSPS